MSDMGDDFKALREDKRAKKKSNLAYSTDLLNELGIPYESRNAGVHLIVSFNGKVVDFWPSTGKFICRSGEINDRGVRNLIHYLQQHKRATLWVLTRELNEYNQDGEYFVAAFSAKPDFAALRKLFDCERWSDTFITHLLNGGGRISCEDEWYNLDEVPDGELA